MSSSHPPVSPLYTPYLTSEELRALRKVPANDLSSEINLLRLLSARFFEFQQSAPQDLASQMQALRTFTLMCHQLAILINSVDRLNGPNAQVYNPLAEALKGISFEIKDEEQPICPENVADSPAIEMLTSMDFIPAISHPPKTGPFPRSP